MDPRRLWPKWMIIPDICNSESTKSFPTFVIGNLFPSSSFPCKRESRFVFHPDGSPPTTCEDDGNKMDTRLKPRVWQNPKEFLRLILGCEFWYIPCGLINPVDAKNRLPSTTNSGLRAKTEHRRFSKITYVFSEILRGRFWRDSEVCCPPYHIPDAIDDFVRGGNTWQAASSHGRSTSPIELV